MLDLYLHSNAQQCGYTFNQKVGGSTSTFYFYISPLSTLFPQKFIFYFVATRTISR